jgi:hypothetical protein
LTRRFLATDPRDKVFALIGLVGVPDSIGLEIDYRLSTEEVYLSVASHSLEKIRDLGFLANGGIGSAPENPKLPSWVPECEHRENPFPTLDHLMNPPMTTSQFFRNTVQCSIANPFVT